MISFKSPERLIKQGLCCRDPDGLAKMNTDPVLEYLIGTSDHSEYLLAKAQWRVVISKLKQAMGEENISKAEMARRMDMTKADFEAFMVCGGDVVPFTLLHRAAGIVGKTIKLEIL